MQSLWDDLEARSRRLIQDDRLTLSVNELKSLALTEIESILMKNGRSLTDFPTITFNNVNLSISMENIILRKELSYDVNALIVEFESLYPSLNDKQKVIFEKIIELSTNTTGGFFFVNGSGGTGKIFLWKTIICKLWIEKKTCLAVASSTIASLLLYGGRNAHSRFKLPL